MSAVAASQSATENVEPTRDLLGVAAAGRLSGSWRQEQEREWEKRMSNLQRFICELLFENQQLGDQLYSTRNRQHWESVYECDQETTRS